MADKSMYSYVLAQQLKKFSRLRDIQFKSGVSISVSIGWSRSAKLIFQNLVCQCRPYGAKLEVCKLIPVVVLLETLKHHTHVCNSCHFAQRNEH